MMEQDLIRRAQAGDQAAFRQLVERYADVAWRTARALLPERTLAEDAVQEAWLDAWRGLARFELGRPFRPWLVTLVANRSRKAVRRAPPLQVPLDVEGAGKLPGGEDPGEYWLRAEAAIEVGAALAALPAEQERVLALRYFAELELAEIATVTGAPLGTVKSRLHRALDAVRARLSRGHQPAPCRE
jgi:RNA polymerase sigma-70 factor (ECF subfamily)